MYTFTLRVKHTTNLLTVYCKLGSCRSLIEVGSDSTGVLSGQLSRRGDESQSTVAVKTVGRRLVLQV